MAPEEETSEEHDREKECQHAAFRSAPGGQHQQAGECFCAFGQQGCKEPGAHGHEETGVCLSECADGCVSVEGQQQARDSARKGGLAEAGGNQRPGEDKKKIKGGVQGEPGRDQMVARGAESVGDG